MGAGEWGSEEEGEKGRLWRWGAKGVRAGDWGREGEEGESDSDSDEEEGKEEELDKEESSLEVSSGYISGSEPLGYSLVLPELSVSELLAEGELMLELVRVARSLFLR